MCVCFFRMVLQETYELTDYIKIGFNGWTGTYTTVDDYITNISTNCGLDTFTFPQNFEITYKYYLTSATEQNNLLWLLGQTENNGVLIGSEGTNRRIRIYNRTTTNTKVAEQNYAFVLNEWNTITITYENDVVSIKGNDVPISYSKTFTPSKFLTYASSSSRMKEFKIKAL